VYKVVVNYGGRTYFIFRRYNEFHHLYEKLKKKYTDIQLKLPKKRLLGNNFDPEFIKARREGLHEFVQKILNNDNVCKEPRVREFFLLDDPRNLNDEDLQIDGDESSESSDVITCNSEMINLGPSHNRQAKPTDFYFLKIIGKGSFGKVLLARHKKENKYYAVKVLQKKLIVKRNEAKHIMAERNVLLKNIKHPFLVGLHYSFQTRDKLYFVLDYVNGGELFFHLQKERHFTETRSRFYSAEIASAIGYLHSMKIVYRDLKPENILLDAEGHIILTDFGLCKEGIEASDTTNTFCGTPEYLAPEVLRKEPYDRSVDWWCLGCVLYEMLYGLPPFYSRDTAEMYDNILHKPLKLRTNITSSARDILEGLLQKKRELRLGAGEGDFKDIKNHAFFRSINWTDLERKKIKPPYNPNVSGQLDLKHIDPEFVQEPVPGKTMISTFRYRHTSVSASVQDPDNAFTGFSYAPPQDDALN
ncbi:uncharacterized protein TRIADDRAFT_27989, partial [Trichoplax adhaerens]